MSEHIKARQWRERLGLTRKQLANLTGYSYESILVFERGETPTRTWSTKTARYPRRNIDEFVWTRYRNCCAGVAAQLAQKGRFEW
jgi:DNA-binding XRE family transcriptional regulator